MPVLLQHIIADSNFAFGTSTTSGASGLVTDFTDQACAAFAQTSAKVMQYSFTFKPVAIGINNRPSSLKWLLPVQRP
jgi:phosphomannomutase